MTQFKLFYQMILRPLRQERLRTAVAILSVALGVAAVLAIELAGDAAAGSFRSSMETLLGDAAFEVTAGGGVPPEAVARLARLPYAIKVHPRMEAYAMISESRRAVPLIGVDLVAESAAIPEGGAEENGDSILVGSGLGYKAGDRLQLIINDTSAEYTVLGILPPGAGDIVLMDLAAAARVLGNAGKLDRILIDVPKDSGTNVDAWESILRSALPAGLTVAREGTQTDENRRMLAAFRWNLRVLSYVALAVGAFLIFNTISVSVVRRRFEIGILRALGVTRVVILAGFLGEAAALGLAGAVAGVGLGKIDGAGAVQDGRCNRGIVLRQQPPGAISLSWMDAWIAIAIGVGVSVISAFSPAWEASQVSPVEAMARGRREYQARVHSGRDLIFSSVLAVGAWLASQPGPCGGQTHIRLSLGITIDRRIRASNSSFCLRIVDGDCLADAGDIRCRSIARYPQPGGILAPFFGAGGRSVHRHRVLVAIGIMVGSFRQTVLLWMAIVTGGSICEPGRAPGGGPPSHHVRRYSMGARQLPRSQRWTRCATTKLAIREYLPRWEAWRPARGRYGIRPFLSGASPRSVWPQLVGPDAVIVSEPFANKHHVHAGDTLGFPLGDRRFFPRARCVLRLFERTRLHL